MAPPVPSDTISHARQDPILWSGKENKKIIASPAGSRVFQTEPTKLELIATWLLQVFGVVLALLFGVFSILAYYSSTQANGYAIQANGYALQANSLASNAASAATVANQLALLSFCSNLNNQSSPEQRGICSNVLTDAIVSQLAYSIFPQLSSISIPAAAPTTTTTTALGAAPTTTSGSGTLSSTEVVTLAPGPTSVSSSAPDSSNNPPPLSIGAIVGIVLGVFTVVVICLVTLRLRQRIRYVET